MRCDSIHLTLERCAGTPRKCSLSAQRCSQLRHAGRRRRGSGPGSRRSQLRHADSRRRRSRTPRRLDALTPQSHCLPAPCPHAQPGLSLELAAGAPSVLDPSLLPWVICAGTRRPQPLDVVGDLAADGDVRLRLPLVPAILAIVPVVLLVLEEPGTQDLRPAVVDDDEGVLDVVPVPAPVVRSPPACLALSSCV